MSWDVVETLCDLVRIPSVNPMGRAVSGDEFLERALTDHLQERFRQLGLQSVRQEVEPGRANIVAAIPGTPAPLEGGQLLVFEAHQDTVPVDGMRIAPWTPEVRDGRVYGRGACDIKGGMACMLSAFSRLAAERPPGMPTLVMACSVNEEHGFTGALSLARSWAERRCALVPRVPDAVIVAEPTQLNVVVTHKGVVRWRCRTRGRAAHSSQPDQGINAIYQMARVLQTLEEYARDVVPRRCRHPVLGTPTLSVGLISGGISVNTVPDHCWIEIDRRLLPSEDDCEAKRAVEDYLHERCAALAIEHEPPFLSTPGMSDDRNGALADWVAQVAQSCGGPGLRIGVPFGTDAPAFHAIGAPTIVFGPGSIEQAHTADEWIAIDQLRMATEIFHRLGTRGMPLRRHPT